MNKDSSVNPVIQNNPYIDWERLYFSERAKNQVLEDTLLETQNNANDIGTMTYELNVVDNISPALEKIFSLLDRIGKAHGKDNGGSE